MMNGVMMVALVQSCVTAHLLLPLSSSDPILARPMLLRGATCRRRCVSPRCGGDEVPGDEAFSLEQLRMVAAKHPDARLGKFDQLRKEGPQHLTSPRQVVEFVMNELSVGNVDQAFMFTCVPVAKRGVHKSSTDWSRRMNWETCKVINGAPSGVACDATKFDSIIRSRFSPLLATSTYRFVGDTSAWQVDRGREKMTAVKNYVVEAKTRSESGRQSEHLLLKFRLVYDWLLYCHLVASCTIVSVSIDKHFPGAEDDGGGSLDI